MRSSKAQRVPSIAPCQSANGADLNPRGWIAHARMLADGSLSRDDQHPDLFLFCLSVREDYPTDFNARLSLLSDVFDRFGPSVPAGSASLWVLPGGYFGFDASAVSWDYLDYRAERRLDRAILNTLRESPVHSTLAFGVDTRKSPEKTSEVRQFAWIAQHHPGGRSLMKLTRGETSLNHRLVNLGPLKAAFFVCGEFTGSHTTENGPFFKDEDGGEHFLDDATRQLDSCNLLVDLAHRRVSGSVSETCSRRMVHRLQMNRFAQHGAAALAHHHRGNSSFGRAHYKHQSNWIVFRGGAWLPSTAVAVMQ